LIKIFSKGDTVEGIGTPAKYNKCIREEAGFDPVTLSVFTTVTTLKG
jgi:hypothetical protein